MSNSFYGDSNIYFYYYYENLLHTFATYHNYIFTNKNT